MILYNHVALKENISRHAIIDIFNKLKPDTKKNDVHFPLSPSSSPSISWQKHYPSVPWQTMCASPHATIKDRLPITQTNMLWIWRRLRDGPAAIRGSKLEDSYRVYIKQWTMGGGGVWHVYQRQYVSLCVMQSDVRVWQPIKMHTHTHPHQQEASFQTRTPRYQG